MYDAYKESHSPKYTTPEKYVEAWIKILKRDFRITPTPAEMAHLKTLKAKVPIDNAILSIMDRHWS